MQCSIVRVLTLTTCGALMGAALVAQQQVNSVGPSATAYVASSQPATTQPALERPLYAGHAPDEWASYQAMHAYFLQRFVDGQGFGLERMVNLKNPRFRRLYADGIRYSVGGVQLLSLNGGNAPFAYVTTVDADKQRIKRAAHEPLGDAEIDGITKLKEGMTVVLTGNEGHREMIGAIRATADCTQCHDVNKGTLLGAFRYPLLPEIPAQSKPPKALIQKH